MNSEIYLTNKIEKNIKYSFDILLTVHLNLFILVINQIDAQNFVLQ